MGVFCPPGCDPCETTTVPCQSVLIATLGCNNQPLPNTTVTLKLGTTVLGVQATSADQRVYKLTRTAAGSGYTDGSAYALGFTGGGGSGAAGTFDVISGQVSNLALTNSGSGYTSAPTLSFPGAGSGTGAAATAATGYIAIFSGLSASTSYVASVSESLSGRFVTTTGGVSTVAGSCNRVPKEIAMNPDSNYLCLSSFYNCGPYPIRKLIFVTGPAGSLFNFKWNTNTYIGGQNHTQTGTQNTDGTSRHCTEAGTVTAASLFNAGTTSTTAQWGSTGGNINIVCVDCDTLVQSWFPGVMTGTSPNFTGVAGNPAAGKAASSCSGAFGGSSLMAVTCPTSLTTNMYSGSLTITGGLLGGSTYAWSE